MSLAVQALVDLREAVSHTRLDAVSQAQHEIGRATIVTCASGFEAVLESLVDAALPIALERNNAALSAFREFLRTELSSGRTPNWFGHALDALAVDSHVRDVYKNQLLLGSLLSRKRLESAVIRPLGLTPQSTPDLANLDAFIRARNQIVHDMDYTAKRDGKKRRRRGRPAASTNRLCLEALLTLSTLLSAVEIGLKRA